MLTAEGRQQVTHLGQTTAPDVEHEQGSREHGEGISQSCVPEEGSCERACVPNGEVS